MSRFRLLLTLLLCLAIPAQGMAGVLAAVSACPMAQAAAQHPSMNMDDEATDGCCKSASTQASTPDQSGKTCKTGQDCSSCGHSVPAVRQTAEFAALMAEEFFIPPSFLPATPPSGLWRPPTLL